MSSPLRTDFFCHKYCSCRPTDTVSWCRWAHSGEVWGEPGAHTRYLSCLIRLLPTAVSSVAEDSGRSTSLLIFATVSGLDLSAELFGGGRCLTVLAQLSVIPPEAGFTGYFSG